LCRCAIVAGALAGAADARAQVSGVLGIDSQNRYRGLATDDVGAVLHASVMVDTPARLYAGLSGIWRLHDGGLANADAIVGFSGRFSDIDALHALDAAWGWDTGVHRRHYGGENSGYDFSELMVGLLGPGFSARAWWSPSYFGQPYTSLYGEVNAAHEFDEHWRVFAHVGVLRYGTYYPWPGMPYRVPGRTDGLAGGAYVNGAWELRLARDGLLAGEPFPGTEERQRAPGWILSASYAF
jgi:hypothetical protein